MSSLEKVLLAAAAGKSAGTSAGTSAGRARPRAAAQPDAHQLHVEHEEHLHHLHEEHVAHEEHLHHLHEEHEEHLAHEAASGTGTTTGTKAKGVPGPKIKTPKPKTAAKAKTPKPKTAGRPVTPGPIKVKAAAGLDKVLRLAAQDEHDAHSHLHGECPWYRAVTSGEPAADFKQYCRPAKGGKAAPRLVVKLTPHTAEASTVPKPTVPPGGPGLFRIKGRELPPYVQHLWHHLAPKYGKEKAYGMAVGIVKKWAAGVNPGGKKPTHTHADVRAAASKNVAEWEKDKADAHAQSARRKAGDERG